VAMLPMQWWLLY